MKILLIGASGTIGQAVANELSPKHTVISASRQHGDVKVNITDRTSIEKMYRDVGNVDAVISTTGGVHFGPLTKMTDDQFEIGLKDKLMGQVHLVLIGLPYLNDKGSFTLTSGILNRRPIRLGASASMVNGAIDGFVKSAALEMPRGIRINAISPTVLTESMPKYADYFPGFIPVDAAEVALAYRESVEGTESGQVYFVPASL